jgi:hypothetical protein
MIMMCVAEKHRSSGWTSADVLFADGARGLIYIYYQIGFASMLPHRGEGLWY